ncbi:MAG: methyltransferase [Chitinophagaceae bacterium]
MANPFFKFKQFTVYHDRCAMKITTDACLFGAWCAEKISNGNRRAINCLDIGTGTGLLALMTAQKNQVFINAIEIDKHAAVQAFENIQASPWKERIKVFHTDISCFESDNYDIIISNPPFYENELSSNNKQKNIAHHSEQLKLHHLFTIVNSKLQTDGCAFLLLPYKRKDEIEQLLLNENLFITKSVIVRQSVNHTPFRWMIRIEKKSSALIEEALSIRDDQQKYTPEFIRLLQDYYLYL